MLWRSTCLLKVSQVWLKTFLPFEFHHLWVGVQWLALLLTSKTILIFLVLSDHICPELSRLRFPYSFPFCKLPWYCVPYLYTVIPPYPRVSYQDPSWRFGVADNDKLCLCYKFSDTQPSTPGATELSGLSRLSMPPLYPYSWAVWQLLE